MISSTLQGFQNNRFHTQDMLGSACAATLVVLTSKYIQQITNLTAFAAAANGTSVLVVARSVNTLCTSSEADKKFTATLTFVFALSIATTATMLRATTVLKSRYNALPGLNQFARPLVATTTATVFLTAAGIFIVQTIYAACEGWMRSRAETLASAKDEIEKENFNAKVKIDALNAEEINTLRGHIERVLASPADRDRVSDDLILWVNTKAGTDQLKIPGWENISRDLGMQDLVLEGGHFARDVVIGIHDNIFHCVPVALQGGAPVGRDDVPARILDRWFPSEIQLVSGDTAATMVAELEKLDEAQFKIIIAAFNEATGKDLPDETTTPQQLIREHLEGVVTLKREFCLEHLDLIRPYGLHQRDFARDLNLLPEDIKRELARDVPVESTMDAYYKDKMPLLKELITAHRGIV